MIEKRQAVLVVGPGPALRWAMEELGRAFGYRLHFAQSPYEAGLRLENTSVDAVVCEAAPAYTADCRLVREICQRSVRVPVFLFVEPESEGYMVEQLGHGGFQVVRPATPIEELHRLLQEAIGRRQRAKAA